MADKKVVGLLLAENIDKAYKIIPNNGKIMNIFFVKKVKTIEMSILDVEISGKVYCCSETPVPVWCGISRIWVLADFRRAKVMNKLIRLSN